MSHIVTIATEVRDPAAVAFDVKDAFDDNGTPTDFSDDKPRGTPLPCRLRGSSSAPPYHSGAMVMDCVNGIQTSGEPVTLDVPGWLAIGAPSLEGVRWLGSIHHQGRGAGGAATPAYDSTQDIDFDHEAEFTQSGEHLIATDERGGGILPPGGADMDSIKRWMRAQPDGGKSLMRENLSKIFFRELTGPGPLGALNLPVTPRGTVAADPLFVPLGAPVWLDVAGTDADGLWVAQDTGGAIKGPNRFDTFWGAGADAVSLAGGMSASGDALVLLPKGVAARALAQP